MANALISFLEKPNMLIDQIPRTAVNKFWDAGTERYLRPVDSPARRRAQASGVLLAVCRVQLSGHYVRASRGCQHNTSATEYRWDSGACVPDVGWRSGVPPVWRKLCAADAKIPARTGSRALAGPGYVLYDLHGPSAPVLLHACPPLVCNHPVAPALDSTLPVCAASIAWTLYWCGQAARHTPTPSLLLHDPAPPHPCNHPAPAGARACTESSLQWSQRLPQRERRLRNMSPHPLRLCSGTLPPRRAALTIAPLPWTGGAPDELPACMAGRALAQCRQPSGGIPTASAPVLPYPSTAAGCRCAPIPEIAVHATSIGRTQRGREPCEICAPIVPWYAPAVKWGAWNGDRGPIIRPECGRRAVGGGHTQLGARGGQGNIYRVAGQSDLRGMVAYGGVVARLARSEVSDDDFFRGFDDDIYDVGDCLWDEMSKHAYWYDRLSDHEIDLLCGVYHVGTGQKRQASGKGKKKPTPDTDQASIVSWWPKPNAWARGSLDGSWWTPQCENDFFAKRLGHFAKGVFVLLRQSQWRSNLKFRKEVKKCWDGVEIVADSVVRGLLAIN
ncbi:hypothetical protein B0H14DRAFT_3156851 [Mycena olivaceomarginata]|nr:hypothetical protein B0H14DRAFT_3156851 [Mycena olivaceomarginata]